MDPFKKIQPQLTTPESGPEPALFDIVKRYYTSNGFEATEALQLTEDYFKAWLNLYHQF